MRVPRHIPRIAAIAALCAGFALPAQAAAEYYVPARPPGGQPVHGESFPGAGGESGGKHKAVTPADTLGAGNAKKLEKHGPAGKAAAEVAAETAPQQLGTGSGTGGNSGGANTGGGGPHSGSNGSGGGSPTSTGSNGQTGAAGDGTQSAVGHGSAVSQPQGSSGLGQVVGQATGAGNGGLGPWLLVAIVLTIAGSIAYRVRMRPGHIA